MSNGKLRLFGRRRAAGLDLEGIGAEGLKCFGISPEKTEGETIFTPAEFAIPVSSELIVGELAGAA